MKSKVSQNVLIGILGTALMKGISFATVIIIGRILTKEDYGNINIYATWVTVFSIFVGFQFNGSLQNALVKFGKEKYNEYCSTLLILSLVTFAIMVLPFCIFSNDLSAILRIPNYCSYFLIPNCMGSFCVGYLSTYFLSQKKTGRNLIYTVTYSLLTGILTVVLSIVFKDQKLGYSLGLLIPNVSHGLFAIVYLLIKGKFKFLTSYVPFALKFSGPLIIHTLGAIILGQSDKLMIEYMLNDSALTGTYSMNHNFAMLANALWVAMNGVFVPYYYESIEDKEKFNSYYKHYSFFYMCIIVGFMLVGPEILNFLTSGKYTDGNIIFPVSVVAQLFIFLYSFCSNYEFYKSRTLATAIGTILAALLNIGLNFWLINQMGILGAAIATAISYLFLCIFHEVIARFVVKGLPVDFRLTLVFYGVGIMFTVATYLIFDYWIARWIIGAVIGVALTAKLVKTRRVI